MPRVYLSYRSTDAAIARIVYQRAVMVYGVSQVMVNPEVHLPQHRQMGEFIAQQMSRCQRAFIIIGPEWTGIDELGCLRLSPADEPVHSEVAAALEFVPEIVPILVNGVRALPAPDDLPEEFHSLYDRPPIILRKPADLDKIIDSPNIFHSLRYMIGFEWLRQTAIN